MGRTFWTEQSLEDPPLYLYFFSNLSQNTLQLFFDLVWPSASPHPFLEAQAVKIKIFWRTGSNGDANMPRS